MRLFEDLRKYRVRQIEHRRMNMYKRVMKWDTLHQRNVVVIHEILIITHRNVSLCHENVFSKTKQCISYSKIIFFLFSSQ